MKRRTSVHGPRFAALLIAIFAIVVALPSFVPTQASAQELIRRRPWSVFDLFSSRRPRYESEDGYRRSPRYQENVRRVNKPRKPKTRAVARKFGPSGAEREITSPVEPVEKLASAKTVLVIGDFLGTGLAEGLDQTFAQEARIRVIDRTKGSSGFVRDDVFNWPNEIGTLVDTEKPAAILVMIGSNDRQQMQVGTEREAPRSDAWNRAYETRAEALADALEAKKIPFVWIGMPPFKSAKMSSDMLAFNDIYRGATESGGGEFIDIWDGFADENGAFVPAGPDVSGQPARLRGSDGINLSKAGKLKVAFYAEKPLRKLLGIAAQGGPALPGMPLSPETPVSQRPTDRTEPMALNDPALDGGIELMGATVSPGAATATAATQSSRAPAGRADSFGGSASTATVPPTTTPAEADTTSATR